MTRFAEVRKLFHNALTANGLYAGKCKRLWMGDQAYYLIAVELQPYHDVGFFVNMGVKFLWGEVAQHYEFTFSHNHRISPDNGNPVGAIFYDSPTFEEEVAQLLEKTLRTLKRYRQLQDLCVMSVQLYNRRDLFYWTNREDYQKTNYEFAVIEMLRGNMDVAIPIFQNVQENNPFARECLQHCSSAEEFKTYITECICQNRLAFEVQYGYRFPKIESII